MKFSISGFIIDFIGLESEFGTMFNKKYSGLLIDAPSDFTVSVFFQANSYFRYSNTDLHPSIEFIEGKVILKFPFGTGEIEPDYLVGTLICPENILCISIEYYLRVLVSILAFKYGGMLIHSAGVNSLERGYLFIGNSGAGKTTIAKYSPDKVILNDDLVVLLPTKTGTWKLYATPFSSFPIDIVMVETHLEKILFLYKNKVVYIEKIGFGEAVAEFLSNVPVIPMNQSWGEEILDRIVQILSSIPHFRLHFQKNPSFWNLI